MENDGSDVVIEDSRISISSNHYRRQMSNSLQLAVAAYARVLLVLARI